MKLSKIRETQEFQNILQSSGSINEIYAAIFRLMLKSVSYRRLAQVVGIKSQGTVADIASGRRNLNEKYYVKLHEILQLAQDEVSLLEAVFSDNPLSDIIQLQKKLRIKNVDIDINDFVPFKAIEVFSALGLFVDGATLLQIQTVLPNVSSELLELSLTLLSKLNVIEIANGKHRLICSEVKFKTPGNLNVYQEMTKEVLLESAQNVESWYPKRDRSYFETTVISLKKSDIPKLLQLLRQSLDTTFSQIEDNGVDSLMRVNIQAYPLFLIDSQ